MKLESIDSDSVQSSQQFADIYSLFGVLYSYSEHTHYE